VLETPVWRLCSRNN